MRLGDLTLQRLREEYPVTERNIGKDARLDRSGMHFTVRSWDVDGLGTLCVMDMKAMLGLMKMETVVLSVWGKDVPLINLDWVSAFGKETQIAELYDDQLEPYPQQALDEFGSVKKADSDLPDYPSAPAWYDSIKYECSYGKSGKGISDRLSAAAERYTEIFCDQLKNAPECDPKAKKEKIR